MLEAIAIYLSILALVVFILILIDMNCNPILKGALLAVAVYVLWLIAVDYDPVATVVILALVVIVTWSNYMDYNPSTTLLIIEVVYVLWSIGVDYGPIILVVIVGLIVYVLWPIAREIFGEPDKCNLLKIYMKRAEVIIDASKGYYRQRRLSDLRIEWSDRLSRAELDIVGYYIDSYGELRDLDTPELADIYIEKIDNYRQLVLKDCRKNY